MASKFPLDEVKHIERAVVGPTRVDKIPTPEEMQAQMDWVNRMLSEGRGMVIGTEKGVVVLHTGDQQLVMQHTAYHIGFKRKPVWIKEGPKAPPAKPRIPDAVANKL